MRYFHGSYDAHEAGTVFQGRGSSYEEKWAKTDFYAALERWRPADKIAHRDAVFLVADPDDLDAVGSATDWCLEMEPLGPVSCHDVGWSSTVSLLISDGHKIDSAEVQTAAEAYWSGRPCPGEEMWEYITTEARVLRCGPYDTFDPDEVPLQAPRL